MIEKGRYKHKITGKYFSSYEVLKLKIEEKNTLSTDEYVEKNFELVDKDKNFFYR